MSGSPAPVAVDRHFWLVMAYSVVLGVVGVVAGLIFLGVTGLGESWYGDPGIGWFDGHLWWVPVAALAGLVVGLLRRATHLPGQVPGLIEDLQQERVDARRVPAIVGVSAVSLLGGASLGPEVALGQIGGGAAATMAQRQGLDEETTKSLTLSGMAGAFGGLFSSPLLAMLLVLEIARPPVSRYIKAFYASLVSSSIAFGIYFAIAGSIFLGIYEVPAYDYQDWHLVAGIGFGLLAAFIALVTGAAGVALARAFGAVPLPDLAKPVLGGIVFSSIGVVLPLTNFTGSNQLDSVLSNGSALGAGLLLAIVVGKILAFAVSTASGFIGGPIFPVLFIGGASGVLIQQLLPDVPLGLAFTCMLAAVAGSLVAAPFSMVLLAALLSQIGALQTGPVLVAVGVSYLTMRALRGRISARSAATAAPSSS